MAKVILTRWWSRRVTREQTGELTRTEVEEVTRAVRRDLEEFARSYEESQDEVTTACLCG
jgi:hypothetical protein